MTTASNTTSPYPTPSQQERLQVAYARRSTEARLAQVRLRKVLNRRWDGLTAFQGEDAFSSFAATREVQV